MRLADFRMTITKTTAKGFVNLAPRFYTSYERAKGDIWQRIALLIMRIEVHERINGKWQLRCWWQVGGKGIRILLRQAGQAGRVKPAFIPGRLA